jgi:hypothetical protein
VRSRVLVTKMVPVSRLRPEGVCEGSRASPVRVPRVPTPREHGAHNEERRVSRTIEPNRGGSLRLTQHRERHRIEFFPLPDDNPAAASVLVRGWC